MLASWGPLGKPLGGYLGRVGGVLALLEAIGAIAGCLERCGTRLCGLLDPSWEYLGASWAFLGPFCLTGEASGRPRGGSGEGGGAF